MILALKTPGFVDQIAEIVFDENHGRAEFLVDGLFVLVLRQFVVVIFDRKLFGDLGPQAGVFDRRDWLLRVAVNVHVE